MNKDKAPSTQIDIEFPENPKESVVVSEKKEIKRLNPEEISVIAKRHQIFDEYVTQTEDGTVLISGMLPARYRELYSGNDNTGEFERQERLKNKDINGEIPF